MGTRKYASLWISNCDYVMKYMQILQIFVIKSIDSPRSLLPLDLQIIRY